MSSEKEMDQVSDKVAIMGLPEVFYGHNHLYVSSKAHDILLDFNAIDALSFSGYDKRAAFLRQKPGDVAQQMEQLDLNTGDAGGSPMQTFFTDLTASEKALNLIDLEPANVQVAQAGIWKAKDTSKIKDYKEVDQTSDWTFASPYKGTTRYLSPQVGKIRDLTGLDIEHDADKKEFEHLKLKLELEGAINFEMLSPQNPILHFGEVYLFESDLEDCGYCMCKIRFRVMADCYYILLRYFLRVDGVLVRSLDTRVFHEFKTDYIHREF